MVVLDASVILKWVLRDEAGSAQALEWRERHRSGIERVAAPELLFYEVANVMVWSGQLTPEQAEASWRGLLAVDLEVCSMRSDLMLRAMALANVAAISVYDACYVALAETVQCDFVTADTTLATKLAGQEVHCVVRTL